MSLALPIEKIEQPVIGYRKWFVLPKDPTLLVSPLRGAQSPWEPFTRVEAVCSYIYAIRSVMECDGDTPGVHCSCGLYAWKTMDDLVRKAPVNKLSKFRTVFGQVSLWGRVIDHESGYRARYGYVYSLFDTDPYHLPEKKMDLSAIANRYGVDIVPAPDQLKQALEKVPPYTPRSPLVFNGMKMNKNCHCDHCLTVKLNEMKAASNG